MKNSYPKIAFSEMLPPDFLSIDVLKENLASLDDIEFPHLRYQNNKFSWYPNHVDENDKKYSELEGIILFYRRQRGRFRDDLSQKENEKFSCQSPCGKKGYTFIGDEEWNYGELVPKEGIECNRCPYSSFTKGSPLRVCRKQIKLFFLVKGSCLPQTLYLDPEAADLFTGSYLMNQVIRNGLAYYKVVTKISLKNGKPNFQIMGELEGKYKEFRDLFMDTMKKDNDLYDLYFKSSFPYGNVDICSCNLWQGCTCGMLHREQLAEINYYNEMGY